MCVCEGKRTPTGCCHNCYHGIIFLKYIGIIRQWITFFCIFWRKPIFSTRKKNLKWNYVFTLKCFQHKFVRLFFHVNHLESCLQGLGKGMSALRCIQRLAHLADTIDWLIDSSFIHKLKWLFLLSCPPVLPKDDVGLGTVVGSAIYNVMFVISMCGLFATSVNIFCLFFIIFL